MAAISLKTDDRSTGIELELIAPEAASSPAELERVEAPKLTLEQSIAKIDTFIAQGKKLCLFVGRTPKEPLPSDRGEAKPDEVWVSLDESDAGPAISADRIHLHFNFNHQELIRKLKKKFDLIVVDFSVMKFLHDDFANRFKVMFRTPETQMMFESATGIGTIADIPRPIFSTSGYTVTSPISMIEEGDHDDELGEFAVQQLKAHLEKTFAHVELIEDCPYPYQTNYHGGSYFIVSNPKQSCCCCQLV
jgi:hypothetical protein